MRNAAAPKLELSIYFTIITSISSDLLGCSPGFAVSLQYITRGFAVAYLVKFTCAVV